MEVLAIKQIVTRIGLVIAMNHTQTEESFW
jgi:hypothetical protein